VSERAAIVRLAQVGLTDETERCRPSFSPSWPRRPGQYYRPLSTTWLALVGKELPA